MHSIGLRWIALDRGLWFADSCRHVWHVRFQTVALEQRKSKLIELTTWCPSWHFLCSITYASHASRNFPEYLQNLAFAQLIFFSLIYYTVQVWASHESSDSEPDDRLQAAQWETIFGHGVPMAMTFNDPTGDLTVTETIPGKGGAPGTSATTWVQNLESTASARTAHHGTTAGTFSGTALESPVLLMVWSFGAQALSGFALFFLCFHTWPWQFLTSLLTFLGNLSWAYFRFRAMY